MSNHDLYNPKHLSKRPFLIINTRFLPGPKAATQVKNWAADSGWNVLEEVVIVDRINNRHQTYATLILDVLEDKVIKNGFHQSTDEDAKKHYLEKYKDKLEQAIEVWATNQARKQVHEQIKLAKAQQAVATDVTVVGDLPASDASAE